MPPTTAEIFADISSNNPLPDVTAYAKAGHKQLALKATESTDYHWAGGVAAGVAAHRLGVPVLWYHFARPGSGKAQAEFFLKCVGPDLGPDDALCIDCEVTGVNGALVDEWLATVHAARPNHQLWVYGSPSFLTENHITPAHGAKLWLADYGVTKPTLPHGWPKWDAWQYTSTGTVEGVKGHVDLSLIAAKPKPPKPVHGSPFIADTKKALLEVETHLTERIAHGDVLTGAADRALAKKVHGLLADVLAIQ